MVNCGRHDRRRLDRGHSLEAGIDQCTFSARLPATEYSPPPFAESLLLNLCFERIYGKKIKDLDYQSEYKCVQRRYLFFLHNNLLGDHAFKLVESTIDFFSSFLLRQNMGDPSRGWNRLTGWVIV